MTRFEALFPALWQTSRLVVKDSRLDEMDCLQHLGLPPVADAQV
jgi:hypothetical protein